MSNILHLSPALTVCEPAPAERVATKSLRLWIAGWIRSSFRTIAPRLRYQSSLSEQTIAATGTSDILRRH